MFLQSWEIMSFFKLCVDGAVWFFKRNGCQNDPTGFGGVARLVICVENIVSPCACRLLTMRCDVDILDRYFSTLCIAIMVGWFQVVAGVKCLSLPRCVCKCQSSCPATFHEHPFSLRFRWSTTRWHGRFCSEQLMSQDCEFDLSLTMHQRLLSWARYGLFDRELEISLLAYQGF